MGETSLCAELQDLCSRLSGSGGGAEVRLQAMLSRVFKVQAAEHGILDPDLGTLSVGFFPRLVAAELADDGEAGLIVFRCDRFEDIRKDKGEALALQVLERLAATLLLTQGASEWLGRTGADSIGLLLPRAGLLTTQERAQAIHETLRRGSRLPVSTGVSHTLDLSGGAPELLRLAGAAAEETRRAGGRQAQTLTTRGLTAPPVSSPPAPAEASGSSLAARYQRLVLLNRMSLELFADKPAEDALSDSCSTILALTGAKYAAVYFCDDLGSPALALRRGEGPWTKEDARPREVALVARALAERRILTPEDGPEAWAAAPLLRASPGGPSALGVLVLGLIEPRRDPELEQTLLEISRLLRNARLMHKHMEQQEVLAAVTEQSADAIYITDRGHRIMSWNSSAEALFGYPSAEVLGRAVDFLIPKDRLAEAGERAARAEAEGRAQTFETVRLRKDGELVPVEATFFPLRDDQGRAIGMVRVFRDITKRKEVERMKSEFVSMVSHELRTPLTAIQGFAETIFDFWDELKTEQRRHYLTIILSEAERLGRLVTNFLDISRLEAGGVKIKPALVDLPDLARRAAALFKEHPSRTEFAVEFAPGSEKAWADEEQLYRVFVNLLGNAVKYSPTGGRVTVSGRLAGAEVEVAVTDQGPGIPLQAQEHLFQKFYRVGDPISRKTPGTGLGLAICRNIVSAHGGRIWAQSAPGRGASFKFSFPKEGLKPA